MQCRFHVWPLELEINQIYSALVCWSIKICLEYLFEDQVLALGDILKNQTTGWMWPGLSNAPAQVLHLSSDLFFPSVHCESAPLRTMPRWKGSDSIISKSDVTPQSRARRSAHPYMCANTVLSLGINKSSVVVWARWHLSSHTISLSCTGSVWAIVPEE